MSRPWFFALYLLGAEVFAVKTGPVDPDPERARERPAGGEQLNAELGFGIQPWDTTIGPHEQVRPC